MFEFIQNFWNLSLMIGIYVLIGLLFVGLVHLYISEDWIKKNLGVKSRFSALKGALYGIPLPLCSCGVIPLAASLRQKGASKKAVTSFFITTPMTGVDSIIATYGVFGAPMAIFRVVSSFISGVLAGSFVKDDENKQELKEVGSSCCSSSCCDAKQESTNKSLKKALDYSLNEVFNDIAKPMLYGLVLATIFLMVFSKYNIEFLNENIFISYILVFIISLPLYVCSISAIPLALSMLAVGASPGLAFIFLAAAPATNIITAGIVKKVLGAKVLVIYLSSIISTTLFFALMIDIVLPSEWFSYTASLIDQEEVLFLDKIGAIIFLSLMFYYFFKNIFKK